MNTPLPQTSVLLLGTENIYWTKLLVGLRARSELDILDSPSTTDVPFETTPEVILAERECDRVWSVVENVLELTSGRTNAPKVLVVGERPIDMSRRYAVHGVLTKERSVLEVAAAIRIVASGYWLSTPSPTANPAIPDDGSFAIDQEALASLSERELEVLRCIAEGRGNAEISKELFLSVSTVKSHIRRLFGKLGITNRTQAVIYAHECGIAEVGIDERATQAEHPGMSTLATTG